MLTHAEAGSSCERLRRGGCVDAASCPSER